MNNESLIQIIVPESPKPLRQSRLCEVFIGTLLRSESNDISLKIDSISKYVKCDEQKISEFTLLVLKSGKMVDLHAALVALLHESESPAELGEIRLLWDERLVVIRFESTNKNGITIWRFRIRKG